MVYPQIGIVKLGGSQPLRVVSADLATAGAPGTRVAWVKSPMARLRMINHARDQKSTAGQRQNHPSHLTHLPSLILFEMDSPKKHEQFMSFVRATSLGVGFSI